MGVCDQVRVLKNAGFRQAREDPAGSSAATTEVLPPRLTQGILTAQLP